MSQSAQLTNAASELRAAAGKYTGVVSELAGLVGVTSGTVSVLNQLNAGNYIQAAVQTWKGGARDAYRVTDALTTAATAMTTLAQGIENNLGPIAAADAIVQNPSAKSQEIINVEKQASNSLEIINGLASTFVATLVSSAEPRVVGACSTGSEALDDGEWDGVTGEVPGMDLAALRDALGGGSGNSGNGGGSGNGNGGGNGWWDAMCEAGTASTAGEVIAEKSLLQKLQGLLSKEGLSLIFKNADGTINKGPVVNIVGMPLITVGMSAAYNTQLIVQEGGVDGLVKKSIGVGILTSLLDGAPYFMLAKKIPVPGGYKLANCTYPLLAAQALFGGVVIGGGGQELVKHWPK